MAALLGGASGAAGAGAMGAGAAGTAAGTAATTAGTAAGTSAATAAPIASSAAANYAAQSGQYGAQYAPPAYTQPQTMSGTQYLNQMQGPQQPGFNPQGPQFQEDPLRGSKESWMHKLMEYAKKNPGQAPDRSMPSGGGQGAVMPPSRSPFLMQPGPQYPTLSSLLAGR